MKRRPVYDFYTDPALERDDVDETLGAHRTDDSYETLGSDEPLVISHGVVTWRRIELHD
jgi:hypothetical protein